MAEYALLNADGHVENVIVADADFITALPGHIADPNVDTGALAFDTAVELTDELRTQGVGIGWKRGADGTWTDERPKPEPPADAATPATPADPAPAPAA